MISRPNRLAAVVAATALTLGFAGCGGSEGGGQATTTPQDRTDVVQGGTVYSLEQAVTEHLDPQRLYSGRDIANLGRLVYRSWVVFPPGATDTTEGSTPIPDLATDTGQSNEDATEWSFTLKDGPVWQDGKPITCEDFKYGVSRTFATDVITGGPNYILGYLDVPEDADGEPVYKGPYTGAGQAEFDKAVTCDGNTITYRFKKPWPDFPLAIAALRAFDPYRADLDQGDQSDLAAFSSGPYMLEGEWNEDTGGTFVRNPNWDGDEDKTREANPEKFVFQIGIEPEVIIDRLIANEGDDQNAISTRNVTPAQYPQITGDVAARAVNIQSPFSNYLLPNFNRITNLKVRQALALATDRGAYVGALGGDNASSPSLSIVNPATPGYVANANFGEPEGGDIAGAKQLLAGVRRDAAVPDQADLPDRFGRLGEGLRGTQGDLRRGRLRPDAGRPGPVGSVLRHHPAAGVRQRPDLGWLGCRLAIDLDGDPAAVRQPDQPDQGVERSGLRQLQERRGQRRDGRGSC